MREREFDIGDAHAREAVGALLGDAQPLGELAIALGGDGGEQMILVGEMPVGGGRRDADPPRRLAQADGARAVGVEQFARGGDQRRTQDFRGDRWCVSRCS